MKRSRPSPSRRAGFTVIELLATVVILSAIGTGISTIIFTALDGYLDATVAAQLHSETSIALDRIEREVRNIQLDAGATDVAPDIDTVTESSIAWNGGSLTLVGDEVLLSVGGGPASVLLHDVVEFLVRTYDENNDPLATTLNGPQCDAIRRVEIQASVNRDGASESLRSRVFIRATMAGAQGGP